LDLSFIASNFAGAWSGFSNLSPSLLGPLVFLALTANPPVGAGLSILSQLGIRVRLWSLFQLLFCLGKLPASFLHRRGGGQSPLVMLFAGSENGFAGQAGSCVRLVLSLMCSPMTLFFSPHIWTPVLAPPLSGARFCTAWTGWPCAGSRFPRIFFLLLHSTLFRRSSLGDRVRAVLFDGGLPPFLRSPRHWPPPLSFRLGDVLSWCNPSGRNCFFFLQE